MTAMRTPDTVTWKHTASYTIDPEVDSHLVHGQLMDKEGDYIAGTITRIVVTWYDPTGLEPFEDNDPSIDIFATPVTKSGKVDKRRAAQRVYFPTSEEHLLCLLFGIDLSCPVR
jgi:hypothetical protein